jgi:hypothetical protein
MDLLLVFLVTLLLVWEFSRRMGSCLTWVEFRCSGGWSWC